MRTSLLVVLVVAMMMEPWLDHLLVQGFSSSKPVNKKSFGHGGSVRVVPTTRSYFSWKNYQGAVFVEGGGAKRSERQQEVQEGQKEGPSLGLFRRLFVSRRKYKDTETEGPTSTNEEIQEETSSGSVRRRLNRIISRFRRDVRRLDTPSSSHASLMTTTTNLDVVQEETTTIQDNSILSTIVSIQELAESATAAPGIDLSGSWKLIVTPEFKYEYNEYLLNCSQPFLFRKIMVNGVAFQHEQVAQLDGGRALEITSSNPAGNWKRTLVASERRTTVVDPDGDCLEAECWWEEKGTKHRSWLRGKERLQGGCFESLRYVDHNDNFVCESTFHPGSSASDKFKPAFVMWRYQRDP